MPGRLHWLRISALCLGILWLFWLPVEENGLLAVYLFAVGSSALAVWRMQRAQIWRSWKPGYRIVSLGFLAGFLVAPIAILLMAFKSGLHGHNAPDYTPGQIIVVIQSLPWWLAGGGILGLGWHIWISSASTTKL